MVHGQIEDLQRALQEARQEVQELTAAKENFETNTQQETCRLQERLRSSERLLREEKIANERALTDFVSLVAVAVLLKATIERALQELQHLAVQVRDLEMLLRNCFSLLPGAKMVETCLHHIPSLAGDYCITVDHLKRCSSCQLVMPLLYHIRTCDKFRCEKCEKLVTLYIVHISHCLEPNCTISYCIDCRTLSQQRNLSTQDLETDRHLREYVQSHLRILASQANEVNAIFAHGPGDGNPYHSRQMTAALRLHDDCGKQVKVNLKGIADTVPFVRETSRGACGVVFQTP
ncbi:uncharacterized protein LOC118430195 [Branchiostoma floridae]|uniref:Uncharacterized protein LOC118430195 n=1 Tax=Branchiostoma floridae TaxID=7739 RepID=A0A9J7N865_BRAFL|nr:uncharacterized protein LOC118430195 [Branchiostoma floridae]